MSAQSAWTVVGDGRWGTALAARIGAAGHPVRLVGLARSRKKRPANVKHTTDLASALKGSERILVAVPIGDIEGLLREAAPHLQGNHRIITTARGLSPETHWRASEAVQELTCIRQVAVLAGSADAGALEAERPAALVVGSPFERWADEVQDTLGSASLRVYTNSDLIGVELSNALATVVGVAMGAIRSLAYGPATEATALTRAVAEMDRLVCGLGGRSGTAHGLAGLGVVSDLVLSGEGVSFEAGLALGQGKPGGVAEAHPELLEGARTMAARARSHGLRAPMVEVVRAMLEGEVTPEEAGRRLMTRVSRSE